MASPISKQLGDFLQEQQEPFTMKDYLHDRGYPNPSAQFLKGSTSCGTKKRRRSLPSCSKIVGAAFNRKFKNCWSNRNGRAAKGNCKQDLADEDDHLSSASSSTVFNSCSEIDAEDDEGCKEKQVLEDRKMRFRYAEDRKQLSPVSVLEETESSDDDVSPIHQIKETSDSQTTLVGTAVASQYARNRNATQQTKQLLFDCVTEVVESHRRKDLRGQQMGRILDPEQLWKLICENIWAWSQDPIDETNINQLVHFDFLDSEAEWRGFRGVQAQEIGVIISEIMLEDIRDEIVRDMVISFK